jgi:hypothetical protein
MVGGNFEKVSRAGQLLSRSVVFVKTGGSDTSSCRDQAMGPLAGPSPGARIAGLTRQDYATRHQFIPSV